MGYIGASVQAVIDAPIERLWQIVSDVTRHPALAGSGEVQKVEMLPPGEMGIDALFESQQHNRGISYVTVSKVVGWFPPYRFAWRVGTSQFPGVAQIWQFDMTPRLGKVEVENSITLPYVLPDIPPFTLLRDYIANQEAKTIRPTLVNLARLAGAEPPTDFEVKLQPPDTAIALLPVSLIQEALWVGAAAVSGIWLIRRLGKKTA